MNRLQKGLRELGLETEGAKPKALAHFISEIELWNPQYGLIAPNEDLVGRHILDSLSALAPIRGLGAHRLADIGSGAGLPGIPLAIWLEDVEIALVEKSGRRAGFLRTVVTTLGLQNVTVYEMPVEEMDVVEARFDVITFRAWSALDDALLETLFPLLAPKGCIAAYKGRRSVVDRELSAVGEKASVSSISPLTIPGLDDERFLVVLRPNP